MFQEVDDSSFRKILSKDFKSSPGILSQTSHICGTLAGLRAYLLTLKVNL